MPYSESELVVPALDIIAQSQSGVSTTALIGQLRLALTPSGHDLKIIANRSDDYFSQKVRNLVSHKTLEQRGFATRKDGKFFITDAGRSYREERSELSVKVRDQGFPDSQRQAVAERDYNDIIIEEGRLGYVTGKVYERSSKLTELAKKHFSDESGNIQCAGCGFDGRRVYGEIGSGLIEIHHLRPLFLREGAETAVLDQALKEVSPLCPNCHRIVHRWRDKLMTLEDMKHSLMGGPGALPQRHEGLSKYPKKDQWIPISCALPRVLAGWLLLA